MDGWVSVNGWMHGKSQGFPPPSFLLETGSGHPGGRMLRDGGSSPPLAPAAGKEPLRGATPPPLPGPFLLNDGTGRWSSGEQVHPPALLGMEARWPWSWETVLGIGGWFSSTCGRVKPPSLIMHWPLSSSLPQTSPLQRPLAPRQGGKASGHPHGLLSSWGWRPAGASVPGWRSGCSQGASSFCEPRGL